MNKVSFSLSLSLSRTHTAVLVIHWEVGEIEVDTCLFVSLQVNCPAVMRKNTKHLRGQQKEKFLRVPMSYVAHVLELEIHD